MKTDARIAFCMTILMFMLTLALIYTAAYNRIMERALAPRSAPPSQRPTPYPVDIIQRERQKRVQEMCKSKFGVELSNKSISTKIWMNGKAGLKPRVFFSSNCKLLVCDTTKCASTEWRNAVLIMDKLTKFNTSYQMRGTDPFDMTFKQRYMWNVFKPGTSASDLNKTDHMINKYFKVLTVREPLERLVSAYKDKLETYKNPIYSRVSEKIHKTYGNGSGGLASFSEFVEEILHTKHEHFDPHWMSYTDLCDPCRMKYDYIAKLETIYDDGAYIAEKVGFDAGIMLNVSMKNALRQKWDNKYFVYYDQLSPEKRTAIFKVYKSQYDVFGYPYPKFAP